jgi:hypothetical protein
MTLILKKRLLNLLRKFNAMSSGWVTHLIRLTLQVTILSKCSTLLTNWLNKAKPMSVNLPKTKSKPNANKNDKTHTGQDKKVFHKNCFHI